MERVKLDRAGERDTQLANLPRRKREAKRGDSLFHPLALSTALTQPAYFHSFSSSVMRGLNVLTLRRLTFCNVSGRERSQPKRPSAPPARRAAPRTVDLRGTKQKRV